MLVWPGNFGAIITVPAAIIPQRRHVYVWDLENGPTDLNNNFVEIMQEEPTCTC